MFSVRVGRALGGSQEKKRFLGETRCGAPMNLRVSFRGCASIKWVVVEGRGGADEFAGGFQEWREHKEGCG